MDLQREYLSKNHVKYLLTALHREPRLKGRKRVITLRHSFTRLKTAWFSGAIL
jgi:hypothetical protein